jgi:hypothetical protein
MSLSLLDQKGLITSGASTIKLLIKLDTEFAGVMKMPNFMFDKLNVAKSEFDQLFL